MNIIKKDSFRSRGRLINQTDDMYRVVIDMSRKEYARFTQWKAAQKELEEVKPSTIPNTESDAITLLKECATIHGPFHRQEWFLNNKDRINAVIA